MNERQSSRPSLGRPAWDEVDGLVRGGAFWASVLLPLAYPLVLLGSVTDHADLAVAGLLAVHVVCLVLGHEYERS